LKRLLAQAAQRKFVGGLGVGTEWRSSFPHPPIALGIKMNPEVSTAQPLNNDALLLTFANGEQRVFDSKGDAD
jgi:hypothetical protein